MNILETSVKSDLLCARQTPAVLLHVKKKLLHTLLVLILWNGIDGKKMEQSLGWGWGGALTMQKNFLPAKSSVEERKTFLTFSARLLLSDTAVITMDGVRVPEK